jgi:pseudouridine synthase
MPETQEGERLHVVLARAGVGSRRACEVLIRQGRVSVNGEVVTRLGTKVSPEDSIAVSGKRLRAQGQETAWLMLNKPRGVVSTVSDPQGRRTIMDFVAGANVRLYPVGRLDYHSEGLMLLTNDGPLTHALTHPAGGIPRTYLARIKGSLGPEERERLQRGLVLDGRRTGPILATQMRRAPRSESATWVQVVVTEGRYHLVRDALMRVGHPVSRLRRVAFGPLKLGRLPVGTVRALRPAEIAALRAAAARGGGGPRDPRQRGRSATGSPRAKGDVVGPRQNA